MADVSWELSSRGRALEDAVSVVKVGCDNNNLKNYSGLSKNPAASCLGSTRAAPSE